MTKSRRTNRDSDSRAPSDDDSEESEDKGSDPRLEAVPASN